MSYYIDLHCHLDLYPDFEAAVNACEQQEIYTIAVTTIPGAWPKNKELSENKKFVRSALGLHPQLASDKNSNIEIWDRYFPEAKYIGEIGLDASPRFYSSFEKQQQNFTHVLQRCAEVGGKILSVHSVRTAKIVLDNIANLRTNRNNKIILHWFTGTASEAKKAVDLGCYFSVNIAMLQSLRSKDILASIPIERLLTETDGPFVNENDHPINPGSVQSCIEILARHFQLSSEQMKDVVFQNFSKCLRG